VSPDLPVQNDQLGVHCPCRLHHGGPYLRLDLLVPVLMLLTAAPGQKQGVSLPRGDCSSPSQGECVAAKARGLGSWTVLGRAFDW